MNASLKFEQFEIQLDDTTTEIHFEIDTLTERVNMSAADIETLQWEVRANNTATQQEISTRRREIHELKSVINATETQLIEKLSNVTESLSDSLKLRLAEFNSQINTTHASLSDRVSNRIQELQVRVNNLIQGVTKEVEYAEQKIENTLKNLTLHLTQNFEATIHATNLNVSLKFEQFEIQLANTTTEIHFEIDTLTERVNMSAADNLAVQLEVHANNTEIQTGFEKIKEELENVIKATQAQLNETASLTEILYQRLSRAEIQLNDTHSKLKQ